jgi:glycosyltransferase involved in cell wall biosynthesis
MGVYNVAEYVEETVHSVFAQTMQDWEIVAVDDGSTDRTFEVLSELARRDTRISVFRQANSGTPARARNTGVAHARGDIITFLDGDDLYHPEKLAIQVRVLEAFPDIGATFHDYHYFYSGTSPETGKRFLIEEQYLAKARNAYSLHSAGSDDVYIGSPELVRFAFTDQLGIHTSAIAVRRAVLDKLGTPFDESLPHGEDIHCWMRVVRETPLAYVDRALSFYRFNPQGWMATNTRRTLARGAYLVKGEMLRWIEGMLPPGEWPAYRDRVAVYWHGIGYRCLVAGLLDEARVSFHEALSKATDPSLRFRAQKGLVATYFPASVMQVWWRLRGAIHEPARPRPV